MKQFSFLLLTFSAFLLTTCGKDGGRIYLTGQVYDQSTHQGVAGIKLRLYKSTTQYCSTTGYDNTKLLEEVTTDANGYYLLKHAGGYRIHFVEVDPQNYYAVGWADHGTINRVRISGTHKNMDFLLLPYGYLKEDVHNVNCIGPDEIMVYRRLNLAVHLDGKSKEYYGCASEDGTEYQKYPMGWVYYDIMRSSGWDSDILYDSVYVGAGEYVEHTINY